MKRGTAKEQERKEACERTEKDAKQVMFLNLSLSRQPNVEMWNVGVAVWERLCFKLNIQQYYY